MLMMLLSCQGLLQHWRLAMDTAQAGITMLEACSEAKGNGSEQRYSKGRAEITKKDPGQLMGEEVDAVQRGARVYFPEARDPPAWPVATKPPQPSLNPSS